MAPGKQQQHEKPQPVLSMTDMYRTYHQGEKSLEILRGVDLEIDEGEVVALVGVSGSGKSTLLQIAGLLDTGFDGEFSLFGKPVASLAESERAETRLKGLGFVYQRHHLLPDFTAAENVMMPLLIAGVTSTEAAASARELLTELGLADREDHYPSQLSGGEQQRVAIARAMVGQPKLLLADEPTGNLDWETADRVMTLMLKQVRKRGLSALIVTHDRDIAARMDRALHLVEGKLTSL